MSTPPPPSLYYLGFNQDYSCFVCGTSCGFAIYNTDPYNETLQRDFDTGGFGHIEMLYRCNIMALIGGGPDPHFPPNKVMLWDDNQTRCIGELSFKTPVHTVRMRRDKIVVVLDHKIYVYRFEDLKALDTLETIYNPKGLCVLCPCKDNDILVCPGTIRGTVRIEFYDMQKTTLIEAHDSNLATFALNADGSLLATASERGTLIRIFSTLTGRRLQELRRGVDRVEICSIAFSPTSEFLAVSSDKGTVHVFHVAAKTDEKEPVKYLRNASSSLSVFKNYLPGYFSSEWSISQFRIPDAHSIVAFGKDPATIIVVTMEGKYYKASFDPKGKTPAATQEEVYDFMGKLD